MTAALPQQVPRSLPLDLAHVHPMPADDRTLSPEQAAARYATSLGTAAAHAGSTQFDVVMLGVGEDGHVASLFPGHPELAATGVTVGVHDSPKPSPVRVSLTYEALNRASEVWFVAAGEGTEIPAWGVRGRRRTQWLLDTAAASRLG